MQWKDCYPEVTSGDTARFRLATHPMAFPDMWCDESRRDVFEMPLVCSMLCQIKQLISMQELVKKRCR